MHSHLYMCRACSCFPNILPLWEWWLLFSRVKGLSPLLAPKNLLNTCAREYGLTLLAGYLWQNWDSLKALFCTCGVIMCLTIKLSMQTLLRESNMVVSAKRLNCVLMKLWLHIHRGLVLVSLAGEAPGGRDQKWRKERRGAEGNPIQCEYMQKAMVHLH